METNVTLCFWLLIFSTWIATMLWLIGNIICWTLLRWIMWWYRLAEILKCLYKQVIWAVKGTLHDHFEVKWKLMPEILNNVQYWTLLQNWWIELIKTLSLFWNCTKTTNILVPLLCDQPNQTLWQQKQKHKSKKLF